MKLPEKISILIENLSEEGNQLSDLGNNASAIEKWKEALKYIPNPKKNWNASMWLYASIGDALYNDENYIEARDYFIDAYGSLDGVLNPFVLYRLGQCEMKCNNKSKSIDYLLRAYMLDGLEIFNSDENGAYFLNILKSENLI